MSKLISLIKNNKGFVLFIVFLLVFRGAIADWHPVPTGSMKPTILEGDVIWENKLAYDLQIPFTNISLMRTGEPKRGDIIVFTSAVADKRLIKRLVGLPGDTIEVQKNQLFINGEKAEYTKFNDESLEPQRKVDREVGVVAIETVSNKKPHVVQVKPGQYNPLKNFEKTTVPEDHYFFMGDNRDNSADSRWYGVIPRSELRGHATRILLSLNTNDSYKPRFERFMEILK